MKTSKIAIIFCLLLVTSSVLPLVFADVPLTSRFDQTGHYGIVAAGVGLMGKTSGTISIDVPGTIVAAYLYWAGYDIETGGDDSVQFDGFAVTADQTYGPEEWVGYNYHYVYVKDITALSLVNTGPDTYAVADLTLGVVNYGAGLLVVYEDLSLPTARIVVMDGLDGFFFDWDPDLGPNSDVACFEFAAGTCDRNADMFLFSGGTEHEDRPNEVWTETGTGTPESDIIDPPSSPTDPPDYPLRAADGPSWDTYTADVLIPAGDEWLCVQIESIESWETGPDYAGRGTSALFIAAGLVLPISCDDFEGLTPGFWKNHVSCWEDYTEGLLFADVFNLNDPVTINVGKKSENADPTLLEALQAKGGVNEEEGIYDALIRHAVAALLNAAHDFVNYPMTEDAIKDAVKLAIENDDMYDAEQLKNELESFNQLGGGIDAHGNPI